MREDVLVKVAASFPRRWIGVGMITTVGALVIYVALVTPAQLGWQVFLLAVGAASFWLSHRMLIATADTISTAHGSGAGYMQSGRHRRG